jgi:XTP/dITP diphosphohydrolase
MIQNIILATSNAGKVKEFNTALENFPWRLIPQSQRGVTEVEETGLTFIENALIKARHAAKQTGLPAIGDDSGLIVDALNGAPGLYSARYAGKNATREQHIAKLLHELGDTPLEKRTARFYCILVFLRYADDPTPLTAVGIWEGSILFKPEGEHGFGYEPIFYVPTHHCSAAEISLEQKTQLSHRGQAWRKLNNLIKLNFS